MILEDAAADFVEEYQTPEQYVQSHIDLLKSQNFTRIEYEN
jgi:hypothetical protein